MNRNRDMAKVEIRQIVDWERVDLGTHWALLVGGTITARFGSDLAKAKAAYRAAKKAARLAARTAAPAAP